MYNRVFCKKKKKRYPVQLSEWKIIALVKILVFACTEHVFE